MELQDIEYKKLLALYQKYFSLHYLNSNLGDKLGVIALTCRITYALRKKGQNITCYDVLLKVGKNFGELEKNTFLKALACVCEDMMYGVDDYPDFGVKLPDAPKQLAKLLGNYIPF